MLFAFSFVASVIGDSDGGGEASPSSAFNVDLTLVLGLAFALDRLNMGASDIRGTEFEPGPGVESKLDVSALSKAANSIPTSLNGQAL